MALFEVEDSYIDQLRAAGIPLRDATPDFKRAKDHETFIQGVSNNPKTRQKLLELIAETGTYVPEIEAPKAVDAKIDALAKSFDDFKETLSEREKKSREESEKKSTEQLIDGGRSYLRNQGWDDDGIKRVETFMTENSVGSYEVASKYLKSQEPDPSPLPNSTHYAGKDLGSDWFSPPEDAPDHKLLLNDPRAFTNNEIRKFFAEKRSGRLQVPSNGAR